jgi:hypothetical protein
MLADPGSRKLKMPKPAWYQAIGKYAYSNLSKSLWQLLDTFVPYCVLWAFMAFVPESMLVFDTRRRKLS